MEVAERPSLVSEGQKRRRAQSVPWDPGPERQRLGQGYLNAVLGLDRWIARLPRKRNDDHIRALGVSPDRASIACRAGGQLLLLSSESSIG